MADPHDRKADSLTAWPWIFIQAQRQAVDDMVQRKIKGWDLLKRWDAMPFELLAVMRAGDVVPINEMGGNRRTVETDPCLYCEESQKKRGYVAHGIDCEHGESIHNQGDYHEKRTCHQEWYESARLKRIHEAKFYLAEVEAYEQAHGLGPLPHRPESAEALAETIRAAGITDAGMVARMVKAAFPETSLIEIGALLVEKEDDAAKKKSSTGSATTKRAQRALKSK